MNSVQYKAYISGALTAVWEKVKLKILYEDIGKLCEKKNIRPYIPHLHQSLDQNPDIPVKEMYDSNMSQVDISHLLIAYVGIPSQGTGMEIERAHLTGADIIILSEKNKQISRMVRGCPAVKLHIEFTDHHDAISQLDSAIEQWLESKRKETPIESGIH